MKRSTWSPGRMADSWHRVIVVLGYHEMIADRHVLSPIGHAVVRHAERVAARDAPRAVIFTGWSSRPGPSEAEQMVDVWDGRRDIPLIREPHACNTAENAVRSLAIAKALGGVSEVTVVCSIRHFPRVRYLFGPIYACEGIAVHYGYVVRPLPSLRLIGRELVSLTRIWSDRRRARRLLGYTISR